MITAIVGLVLLINRENAMGMSYKTVLIAGVLLTRRDVDNGTRTRYNPVSGEPYEEPVTGSEMATESGVVYQDPRYDMTDGEIDDWINPDSGNLCYVGGEAEIHALGVVVESHEPRYEPPPCAINWEAITDHIDKAQVELSKLGITDPVRLLLLTESR